MSNLSSARVEYQSFGSIPSRRNFSRQASLTHELKFPLPATESICSSNISSKRMFFFVLPERSKAGFAVLSCIGTYRHYRLKPNGTYRYEFTQPLNTAKLGSAGTLTEPLTTNVSESNEVAMHNPITPHIGEGIYHPKYQYRFMALSRSDMNAEPCRLSIEAYTEKEARRILAPQYILFFAARLPVQEVSHV